MTAGRSDEAGAGALALPTPGQDGAIAIRPTTNPLLGEAAAASFRTQSRRRTRLQAAKLIDCGNTFLVEALIRDRSPGGFCLLLARNVGLPSRFGVHDDATGEIVTVATAWRRELTLGVRILRRGTASPLKPSDRLALSGRYYGIQD